MTTVLSYHGSEELKAQAVKAAEHHRDADMLRAGTYGRAEGRQFRACSVGCDAFDITGELCDSPHKITAEHWGFPEWLERLRDVIFEGLGKSDRRDFHVDLKRAIPVGVDLGPVLHRAAIRRMDRLLAGLACNATAGAAEVLAAITLVKRCHEAELAGKACDWSAAGSAAESAAGSAAESARLAAESAESAAESARSAAWRTERDDLLEILRGLTA